MQIQFVTLSGNLFAMVDFFEIMVCPAEFSGHPQQILLDRYGDPLSQGWGAKWLVNWKVKGCFSWFPADAICIHKDFQPRLYNAFVQLEGEGLHNEIISFDEGYGIRFISGSSSVLSVHSWGAAIDLNADDNPLGSVGNWSLDFISVMRQNGVFAGQEWTGRKDPMHFAMVNG